MSEICQLCAVTGHTARACPSLNTRCHLPSCNGVMLDYKYNDHAFLKCHRASCSGYLLYSKANESELPDFLLPCEVCSLNGHRPYNCPSSKPFRRSDKQIDVTLPQTQVFEEPIQYCARELCQICYEYDHSAPICSWLHFRCLLPNCDGVWIFHELDANQPIECYNRECMSYKHIGIVRHDETESPSQLLFCQVCGAHGHEAYQCLNLHSLYHQIAQEAGLFCQLCGANSHTVYQCPDVLAVYRQIEEEEVAVSTFTANFNRDVDVPPVNISDEYDDPEDILFSHTADEGSCSHEDFTYNYNVGCFFCDFCGGELEDS